MPRLIPMITAVCQGLIPSPTTTNIAPSPPTPDAQVEHTVASVFSQLSPLTPISFTSSEHSDPITAAFDSRGDRTQRTENTIVYCRFHTWSLMWWLGYWTTSRLSAWCYISNCISQDWNDVHHTQNVERKSLLSYMALPLCYGGFHNLYHSKFVCNIPIVCRYSLI